MTRYNTAIDGLVIRSTVPNDSALIFDFIRQLAIYERMLNDVVATPESIHNELFEKHAAECIIAEYQGAPVGFALFFHNFSTFLSKRGLYLEDLFVLPEARGKGIGKALLVQLAKIALDRQCGRFEWTVLDWNTPSIEFYRSLGAQTMTEWQIMRLQGDALQQLAQQG